MVSNPDCSCDEKQNSDDSDGKRPPIHKLGCPPLRVAESSRKSSRGGYRAAENF
jgi:hypothetical protein